MPKTFSEIKKLSAYSDDFEKAVDFIKTTQEYTVDVVAAIEKLINVPLSKNTKESDLERLTHVAQKLFIMLLFDEALQATANVCISIAKQERDTQMEAFEQIVTPMKNWIQEDYSRLMKDIKKCYNLKDKMDRTMANLEARKTLERLMRAQEAKNKHQLFFERVENEYQFERKAKDEFYAAFVKCEAEINASAAALQEAPKFITIEKTDLKASKNESKEGSEEHTLEKVNLELDRSERKKNGVKQKNVEEKYMNGAKPEKQIGK
uniref:BAR domain-containing protein n=1 Tax=Elaeophora elaphi TaxID=1147741 RepID=A0A0R3RJI9_9BILA